VEFLNDREGSIESISGKIEFRHNGEDILFMNIVRHEGHFPINMLIGGIKQFIEEAIEDFEKGHDSYEKVYC